MQIKFKSSKTPFYKIAKNKNKKIICLKEEISIAGAMYLKKRKKDCVCILEDEDIQVYEDLEFKIKLETMPNKEIPKPDNIKILDISNPLVPIRGTNYFLYEHPSDGL
ncbi:14689_t:CDS:2 [Dentiscutata erythropus]|uniref:14689_t:CDS:1 n=1 Tax=Dentiscutata erythropus TaxID=1348616 RepID=A0A9N9CPE3_9GLOM|nr:14689_t:CDS:2 [Dentiscutata erythropus]